MKYIINETLKETKLLKTYITTYSTYISLSTGNISVKYLPELIVESLQLASVWPEQTSFQGSIIAKQDNDYIDFYGNNVYLGYLRYKDASIGIAATYECYSKPYRITKLLETMLKSYLEVV